MAHESQEYLVAFPLMFGSVVFKQSSCRTMLIISLLLALITGILFKYHWNRRKIYQSSWSMTGPTVLPIVGNALMFLNISKSFEIISGLFATYNSPFRVWLGQHFFIVYHEPEHIEQILNSPHTTDKGDMYKFVRMVLGGDGLFTSVGSEWKHHRKLLNPTIQHFKVLNSFYPIFNFHMADLIKKLESRIDAGQFNIYHFLERCSLNMICDTTFGTKINPGDNSNKEFLDAANVLMLVAGKLITQPWYQLTPVFYFSKFNNMVKTSRNIARSFASKIIKNKIEEYQENNNEINKEVEKRPNNFIDECLKLSKEQCFSEEELINESLTMLIGGFETTATTVSYVVLMLAMFPEYQQQAFDEIRAIFPHQSSDIRAEDIAQLEFVNRFIKETMRLNPTVPFVTRGSKSSLQVGNHNVPKGVELILGIFGMHRNERIWGPKAGQFDPDNFLPENIETKHAYSFIPFSGGPRNCIGLKYGNIVVKMFVCWLVRNYRFTTKFSLEQLQYRMSITLKLDSGHLISVHKRSEY